jgi:hypothetical protein
MSTIRVDADTIADCALIIKKSSEEWHDTVVSCHQKLADMLANGVYRGKTAERMAGEFYNMVVHRYLPPGKSDLDEFAGHLSKVAREYTLTENKNRELSGVFSDSL